MYADIDNQLPGKIVFVYIHILTLLIAFTSRG